MSLYSQKIKEIFFLKKIRRNKKGKKLEGDSINREIFKAFHGDTISQGI